MERQWNPMCVCVLLFLTAFKDQIDMILIFKQRIGNISFYDNIRNEKKNNSLKIAEKNRKKNTQIIIIINFKPLLDKNRWVE